MSAIKITPGIPRTFQVVFIWLWLFNPTYADWVYFGSNGDTDFHYDSDSTEVTEDFNRMWIRSTKDGEPSSMWLIDLARERKLYRFSAIRKKSEQGDWLEDNTVGDWQSPAPETFLNTLWQIGSQIYPANAHWESIGIVGGHRFFYAPSTFQDMGHFKRVWLKQVDNEGESLILTDVDSEANLFRSVLYELRTEQEKILLTRELAAKSGAGKKLHWTWSPLSPILQDFSKNLR